MANQLDSHEALVSKMVGPGRYVLSNPGYGFPAVPKALLEHLEATYPDRAPTPGTTPDQLWFAAGAAHVVRTLRKHYDKQQEIGLSAQLRRELSEEVPPTSVRPERPGP